MHPEKSKEQQKLEAQQAIRQLAIQLAPKPGQAPFSPREEKDDGDPWTLRRLERLETQNNELRVRVDRLEQEQPVTPRFPHRGPPPTQEETAAFLRRVGGWYNRPEML